MLKMGGRVRDLPTCRIASWHIIIFVWWMIRATWVYSVITVEVYCAHHLKLGIDWVAGFRRS